MLLLFFEKKIAKMLFFRGSKYRWWVLCFWEIVAFWTKNWYNRVFLVENLWQSFRICRELENSVELFGRLYMVWERPSFKHLRYILFQKIFLINVRRFWWKHSYESTRFSRSWTVILNAKLMSTPKILVNPYSLNSFTQWKKAIATAIFGHFLIKAPTNN